jgi:hypothetical protein
VDSETQQKRADLRSGPIAFTRVSIRTRLEATISYLVPPS